MFAAFRIFAYTAFGLISTSASSEYLSFTIDNTSDLSAAKVTVSITSARPEAQGDRVTQHLEDWAPTVMSSNVHETEGEINVVEMSTASAMKIYIADAPESLTVYDLAYGVDRSVSVGSPLVLTLTDYGVVSGATNDYNYKTPFPIFYLPDHSAITLCREIRQSGGLPVVVRIEFCRDSAKLHLPFYREANVTGSLATEAGGPIAFKTSIFAQGPMLYTENPMFYIGL